MLKIAAVVLHYMNTGDTIECVDSLIKNCEQLCMITIVDNASPNASVGKLKRRYKGNEVVKVIRAGKNYGFARGNNIGIKYVRERVGANFILCLNSDIIIKKKDFIEEMLKVYHTGVGVIGPEIRLINGRKQQEYQFYYEWKSLLTQGLVKLTAYWGWKGIPSLLCTYLEANGKSQKIIHGCIFMLTPDFLEHYKGLFDKTFLYGEEPILYYDCMRAGLKQMMTQKAVAFHKEDGSSKLGFGNRERVKLRYALRSQKWIWLAKLRSVFNRNK